VTCTTTGRGSRKWCERASDNEPISSNTEAIDG
jgi:hypothetical protein